MRGGDIACHDGAEMDLSGLVLHGPFTTVGVKEGGRSQIRRSRSESIVPSKSIYPPVDSLDSTSTLLQLRLLATTIMKLDKQLRKLYRIRYLS